MKIPSILVTIFILCFTQINSQVRIFGTVYSNSGISPLESVSVMCTCGGGVRSNFDGRYEIEVSEKDSIWFSYLKKETIRYAVKEIKDLPQFDISLEVSMVALDEVRIRSIDYKLDSIQNRIDYANVFEYKKPTLKTIVTSLSITGMTVDLDELIRAFQTRKNRSMQKFQSRLLEQEKDKFIDRRFTRSLVRTLTGCNENSIDSFMKAFRPTYKFTATSSDYFFREYIIESYKRFLNDVLAVAVKKESF